MAKTIEDFYNAYYKKDGIYHTNINKIIDYDNLEELALLYKALLKLLADGEILFVINDELENSASAYILYRKGNWILNQFVLQEEDTYIFDALKSAYSLPIDKELSYLEKDNLIKNLENYVKFENINLRIIEYDFKALEEQREKEPIKPLSKNYILTLAFFWRYIYILGVILAAFITGLISGKYAGLIIGAAGIIYGLYFLLGIRFHFKHVYYIICKIRKLDSDLDNIRWEKLKKSSLYIFPLSILILGIFVFLLSVF